MVISLRWLREEKKPILSLWELNGSSFEQTWILFTQGCFVPSWVEIGPVVLEKRILFISSMYFRYFCNYLPLEKGKGPSFEQTWISFTQGCFVPSLVEIGQVVLWKRIFFLSSKYFRYFCNYFRLEKGGPFIWTNLNPLHQRMLCANLDKIGPVVLEKKDLKILSMYFAISYWFSLEIGREPSFEQTWTPFCAKFGWN